MKKKCFIFIVIIILVVFAYTAYLYYLPPNGSTVESREKILGGTPEEIEWNIAQEQTVDEYILSSICSDGKSGVAVFEPVGNAKYKLVSSEWRNTGDIVISGVWIDDEWYDIVWFNGAVTSYAELTYTVNGEKGSPLVFDTDDMKIICAKAPAKKYSLEVQYYDNDGNVYK